MSVPPFLLFLLTLLFSGKYDDFAFSGNTFLWSRGFQTGREWIGYSFAFMIPFTLIFTIVLGIVLKYVRIEPEQAHVNKKSVSIGKVEDKSEEGFKIPFTPVDLTFNKLVYEVKASTGNKTLRLLNEVTGAFVAGRMCALMGSSGAVSDSLVQTDVRHRGVCSQLTCFFPPCCDRARLH
jgi:hypothetical protein